MRRLILPLAVLVLAVIALVGARTSGASNPSQGADVYGVGGGEIFGGTFANFNFSAHSGPNGDFGHAAVDAPGVVDIYVDIDCVNVFAVPGFADEAQIGGIVRRVSPVPNFLGVDVGDRQLFTTYDRGNPSSVPVDAFYFTSRTGGLDCKLIRPLMPPPNVTSGNVNIKLG